MYIIKYPLNRNISNRFNISYNTSNNENYQKSDYKKGNITKYIEIFLSYTFVDGMTVLP